MNNNQIIINERETGKTTYLFSEVERLQSEGEKIIILDSATEHEEKSLLKKVSNSFQNTTVINVKDASIIAINKMDIEDYIKNFMNYFPFNDIVKNKNKIICFDLSYFLERGHDVYDETQSVDLYRYYRELYNNLAQQIVLCLILMEKFGILYKSTILMDEIEMPIVNYDMSMIQGNLSFLASVHPENAFGTFYTTFDKLEFAPYKRKE